MNMQKKPVVIFGIGNVAEIVDFYFREDNAYDVAAFATSTAHLQSAPIQTFKGKPVVAFEALEEHYPPDRFDMFVAVGYRDMNQFRAGIIRQAKAQHYRLVSYVCSKATFWGDTIIGENVLVLENTLLQPYVTLQDGVFIGRGNSIGHHSTIEDCAFIANHVVLCGQNRIGRRSFIGSNATVNDGINIASDNMIGAHSFIKTHTVEGDVFATAQSGKLDPRAKALMQW